MVQHKNECHVIGRRLLGQKVARNVFCGLFERHILYIAAKKVPKRKTCQMPRKQVICDYLLSNCITAKK